MPGSSRDWEEYYALRWEILRAPWQQPLGSERDEFEEQARHVLVRGPDRSVIGVGRWHWRAEHLAQIRYMAVREAFRGRGVATAVLNHLESGARAAGARHMTLFARESAAGFYAGRGYRSVGPGPTLFGQITHLEMSKAL